MMLNSPDRTVCGSAEMLGYANYIYFQNYKKKRIKQDPEFWKDYDENFETFKLGVMLKQARKEAGLTQEQIASQLQTTKSVISRMENHANDIRLSTLEKFAKALGRRIHVSIL